MPSIERSRHRALPVASRRRRTFTMRPLAVFAFLSVAGLMLAPALAAPPTASLPTQSVDAQQAIDATLTASESAASAQELTAPADSAPLSVSHDSFDASTATETLIANGTNYDWAIMVLTFASWPTTDSNIAVFTRWMRQENGPDDWWNRNNPLNNGWGSGGGSGLGSYDTLVTAAKNAAEALLTHSGYADIRAGFAASAPEGQIEAAIWASPWASSHYGNGSHWSHTPVKRVAAPPGAWQ